MTTHRTKGGPTKADAYIGRMVRTARRQAGVTQQTLAEALGVTYQQLQKYERGRNRIAASTLQRIAGLLDRPYAYFLPPDEGEACAPGADWSAEEETLTTAEWDLVRAWRVLRREVRTAFLGMARRAALIAQEGGAA